MKLKKDEIPRISQKNLIDVIKQYTILHAPLPEGLFGLCDAYSKTIHISSEIAGVSREKTTIHEVIHALDDLNGWKLSEKGVCKLEEHYHKEWYGGE